MKEEFSEEQDKMKMWDLYEEQGTTWAVHLLPMKLHPRIGVGMKLSSPLSTELTKYSIFPVQVPCLFNGWAFLEVNVDSLGRGSQLRRPSPAGEIPLQSASPAQSRRSLCGTRLVLRSDIASVPGKTKKMHQKAPPELWSTSSSWIKRSTDKKCAACGNG